MAISVIDATSAGSTGSVMVSGNMPAFSAYQSTQQTGVVQNVATKVNFQTKDYDTNNNFSSSRFTPTVAGYYQLSAGISTPSASTSSYIQITVTKNGASLYNGTASSGQNGVLYPQSTGSWLVYANGTTDYFEINTYGSNSGSYSLVAQSNATFFNGCLVRAA
jgi:hypothetical protein